MPPKFFQQQKSRMMLTLADAPSAELVSFLNEQTIIRIALHGGEGFGHQAAGMTLMHRLRELGYLGRFHILVPFWPQSEDRTGKNIAQLIPGYNPYNMSTQEIGPYTIDRYDITQNVLDLLPVHLTISPADDFDLIADRACISFNSACYLSMQPTGWRHPKVWYADVLTQEKERVAENTVFFSEKEAMIPGSLLPKQLSLFFQKVTFLKEQGCLTQSLYGFNVEKQKNPEGRGFINTGWMNSESQLIRLIEGAAEAQKGLNKPIILLFHSPEALLSSRFKSSLHLGLSGKKIIFLNGLDADPRDTAMPYDANTIVIWLTGPVPSDVFRQLMFDSDLPPVVEGANTTGFLEANRGYLHGGRARDDFWGIPDEYFIKHGVDLDLRKKHMAANRSIEKEAYSQDNPLGSFYQDVLEGKYDHYFAVCACYFREERPDAVLEGINAIKDSPVFKCKMDDLGLFKCFVEFLKHDLEASYVRQDNIMTLVKRIFLSKANLGEGIDKETLDHFKSVMSATIHYLLIKLEEAKKESKDFGFTFPEEKLRESLHFIEQAGYPIDQKPLEESAPLLMLTFH